MKDTHVRPEVSQKTDYSAVSAIFDQYAPLIHQYVARFCHDPQDAERIVGDVFTQYLEKLSLRKRPPSDPRICLYRMAYDTLARHLGARGQQPPAFIPSLPSREQEQGLMKVVRTVWKEELP